MRHIGRLRRRARTPWQLVAGLVLVAVFWSVYWSWTSAYSQEVFLPLWLGYILTVDGLVQLRTASSFMTRRPWAFLALFPASSAYWALHELVNHVIRNWYYAAPARHGRLHWDVAQGITASIVIPALYETLDLYRSVRRVRRLSGGRLPHVGPASVVLPFAGVVALALTLAFPREAFPLLWFIPFLLLDPLNYRAGRPSLLGEAAEGRWGTAAALALAGLTAGFFWELWNGGSAGYHWVYTIPHLQTAPHLFRMPLLGYLGYPPFAASTYAVCQALRLQSLPLVRP
ncbi:hypothetical protein NGB36_03065 [Streptomyces sp. RB6PN25]|uniref:Uncharacterized protein n=1 Tax=Streptomyces humicola TaxID=2953240 RepID=A0ABT1PPK8_9ACTN|nr:hypothetical protein [Streptomyces humicola]MCQ4079604.1 hypothetical protein [Streptomyces humicola]